MVALRRLCAMQMTVKCVLEVCDTANEKSDAIPFLVLCKSWISGELFNCPQYRWLRLCLWTTTAASSYCRTNENLLRLRNHRSKHKSMYRPKRTISALRSFTHLFQCKLVENNYCALILVEREKCILIRELHRNSADILCGRPHGKSLTYFYAYCTAWPNLWRTGNWMNEWMSLFRTLAAMKIAE